MNRALELRGENHVHEDDREHEGPEELCERAFEFAPLAGDGGRVGRRHVHLGGGMFQSFDAVGERVAGRDRGAQRDLTLTVESVNARGADVALDLDEVVEAYEPAARGRDEEATEYVRVVAVALCEAQLNVVRLVD